MTLLTENEAIPRTLHQRKAMLRTAVLLERDRLTPSVRKERSRAIIAGILALSGFCAARCVLLTSSFGSEVETGDLIVQALAGGKTLLLPKVDKESRMLELYAVADPDSQLARGTYGIAEPRPDRCRRAACAEVEWVLVPGVVYADDGFRVGYGGGYYDRLLPLLSLAVPRVSAAFQLQRRTEVPHGVHDQKIQYLVTESGVCRVGSQEA